jgi:hypothetical protein
MRTRAPTITAARAWRARAAPWSTGGAPLDVMDVLDVVVLVVLVVCVV